MRTCQQCSGPIPAERNTRAKYCSTQCNRKASRDSANKACGHDDCLKPVRARGLCASHYNQAHQPGRHAAKPTACVVCSTAIMRPHKASRRPTCSPNCRHALTGQQYTGDWAGPAHMQVRARAAGAKLIEDFTSTEIFERDNWTCYLCEQPVITTPDCFNPRSATIDHVVPLSKGGQHTRANVQCACLGCNSSKQDAMLTS